MVIHCTVFKKKQYYTESVILHTALISCISVHILIVPAELNHQTTQPLKDKILDLIHDGKNEPGVCKRVGYSDKVRVSFS